MNTKQIIIIDVKHKNKDSKRAVSKDWNFSEDVFTYKYHLNVISRLYLNIDDNEIEHRSTFIKELTNKLYGYKRQDIDKQKQLSVETIETIEIPILSLETLIEKLLCSKLKCIYCKQICELIYTSVLSKRQWTLDRINNDIGHTADNVVICCLDCNLKRGTMDSTRFKNGKQLRITRKNE